MGLSHIRARLTRNRLFVLQLPGIYYSHYGGVSFHGEHGAVQLIFLNSRGNASQMARERRYSYVNRVLRSIRRGHICVASSITYNGDEETTVL